MKKSVKWDEVLDLENEAPRIHDGETIKDSIERIPFLRRFYTESGRWSSSAINHYLGYKAIKYHAEFKVEFLDFVLRLAHSRKQI